MARSLRGPSVAALTFAIACSQAPQGLHGSDPPPEPLRPGDEAPAFSLGAADGRELALGDFEGKSDVLLYFSMGPG